MAKSLSAKILTSYEGRPDITKAGRHACEQLLHRLCFMIFKGTAKDLTSRHNAPYITDFAFDREIVQLAEAVSVGPIQPCSNPRPDIFDRIVLRWRAPCTGNGAPWDNQASVTSFPSALVAAQDFSFESSKVRHAEAIDDVLIANVIATGANGQKTEAYGYMWSWQDTAREIQRNFLRQESSDSFLKGVSKTARKRIPPLACGFAFCGTDTTLDE